MSGRSYDFSRDPRARWIARPLQYIETRLSIQGEKIADAVVLIQKGKRHSFTSVEFRNVVFVVPDDDMAGQLTTILKEVAPSRVVVVGACDALRILSKSQGSVGS